MRKRDRNVWWLVSATLLAACAGDAMEDGQRPPTGDEPAASIPSVAEPAIGLAPAESSANVDSPASGEPSADADTAQPQPRWFGIGTSCMPNPCLNNGTCVDQWLGYTCRCAPGFSGAQCQTAGTVPAGVCGTITIASAADLQVNRGCTEIRGDLRIAASGVAAITASDFPSLTRVTGAVQISAVLGPVSGAQLTSVTLSRLQSVGGEFLIGLSEAPASVSVPALTSVGSLRLVSAGVRVFDAPRLTTVTSHAEFNMAARLCTLNLPAINRIGGNLTLRLLDNLPASATQRLRSVTRGTTTVEFLGCCHVSDRLECQDMPSRYEGCGC